MKQAFRSSLIVALLAGVAAIFVPFSQPVDAAFQLDAPPFWVPLSGLALLVGVPTGLIAFVGLYRFKRWARPLGLFVGVFFAALLAVLSVSSPLLKSLAPLGLGLLGLALAAWLFSLGLAYGKALSGAFGS